MDSIKIQLRRELLKKIKDVTRKDKNGNLFKINYANPKNCNFMTKHNLGLEDVKNIVLSLETKECFDGPEADRNSKYSGSVLEFGSYFEDEKIYTKLRYESDKRTVCMSIHEYGLFN